MYKEYKLFIFINWYLSEVWTVVELQFVNKHLCLNKGKKKMLKFDPVSF